jgi:NAD(P)H-quinone oxidoreductase subunit L
MQSVAEEWHNGGSCLPRAPVVMELDVTLLYGALAGAYLLVLPLLTYFYARSRWYVAGSIERGFMYFLVFLVFPGMLVLSPFLNFRPQRRPIEG